MASSAPEDAPVPPPSPSQAPIEPDDGVWMISQDLEVDAYATHAVTDADLHGIVLAHLDLESAELTDKDGQEVTAALEEFRLRADSVDEADTKEILDEAYERLNDENQFTGLREKLLEEAFDPEEEAEPEAGAAKTTCTLDSVCEELKLSPAARAVCEKFDAAPVESGGTLGIKSLSAKYIRDNKLDDTFYFLDLGNVQRLYNAWHDALPRVTPYFAIKCCPMPSIIALLAANGCGFDCASAAEIQLVLDADVSTDRIIFAHPAKAPQDIRFAADKNVTLTTFDSMVELEKIAKWHDKCELVLRIRADDPGAKISFGVKYGAAPDEYEPLLRRAKEFGLSVVGVSFHVGSMAKNPSAYKFAISEARKIFDVGTELGHKMRLVDLGGGFVGRFDSHGRVLSMLGDVPKTINEALEEHFGPDSPYPECKIIAEPGRYFSEASMHLACVIHSYRVRADPQGASLVDYIISDGLYGSFNAVLYDGARPRAWLLYDPLSEDTQESSDEAEMDRSNVFGPTCDSMDCVFKNVMLPRLTIGDWLLFPHFGAYSLAGACNFNGIQSANPNIFHIVSESNVDSDQPIVILYSCEMEEKPSPIVA